MIPEQSLPQPQPQSQPQTDQGTQLLQYLVEEQKRAKRRTHLKYGFFGVLIAGYVLTMGSMIYAQRKDVVSPSTDYVSLVRLEGEIGPGKPINAESSNALLTKAFSDKGAKGVVLVMNSPGGSPVQSSLIYDHLRRLRAQYPDKKLVVVGEDLVASGGYFIASAADKIVVNRSTVIGSIGVIAAQFGFSGLLEKLGVERRVLTAGEAKGGMDPFLPLKPDDIERQKEMIQEIHTHFIDSVKDGRGERLNLETPLLFSGKVWTGQTAVGYGIADELGDLNTVLESEFKVKEFKTYTPPKSFLDSILSGALAQAQSALVGVHPQGPQTVLR